MKAAPFEYVRAENLEHALEVLRQQGPEAKLLAGGQSLVPMMSMRLARPSVLVDIHRLAELQGRQDRDEAVVTGAGVRQAWLERDAALAASLPLVAQALRWVGHEQTRNRGTVGGSVVHADPSAELPLAAATLDATLVLRSHEGERRVAASEFFLGPMFTATSETECLTAIEWPRWRGARLGASFVETAIRHGDFAMASAAVQLQLDDAGVCTRAALGVGGVDGVPLALPRVAERLVGKQPNEELLRALADEASKACEPGGDIHGTADYRRHLVQVLTTRALRHALATARNS